MRAGGMVVIVAIVTITGCSSSSRPSATQTSTTATPTTHGTTSTAAPPAPLRILVTNDDGFDADGIDALVEALRRLPDTIVTVVAPATNQSGQGSNTTPGKLTATRVTTKSGYAAWAVRGHPADAIVWAFDQHGVAQRPDVVMSGINNGQNLGKYIDISGTVGAARFAAQRGVPALAISQGLADRPDYPSAVAAALAWLAHHRDALADGAAPVAVTNLNVPTCPAGKPRPVVVTGVAPPDANAFATVDCVAAYTAPKNDVDGFVHGYIVETDNLPLSPAA